MATRWVRARCGPCAGWPVPGDRRAGRPRACGCAARGDGGRPRAGSRPGRACRSGAAALPPPCWDSGRAPAPQARQPVAELGQLDLGLALLAVGVLGEDVEDHRGAVDGRAAEDLLEVALLRGRELVVEDDRVGVDRLERDLAELLGLALADVGGRVGRGAALHDARDHVGAGGVDELARARRGRPRSPRRCAGGSSRRRARCAPGRCARSAPLRAAGARRTADGVSMHGDRRDVAGEQDGVAEGDLDGAAGHVHGDRWPAEAPRVGRRRRRRTRRCRRPGCGRRPAPTRPCRAGQPPGGAMSTSTLTPPASRVDRERRGRERLGVGQLDRRTRARGGGCPCRPAPPAGERLGASRRRRRR